MYISVPEMVGEERTSTRCRVLIVEDDAVACQAMRALLVRWGYEVETSQTAADARRELAEVRAPACIILDLMHSDSNGVELLRMIREQSLPVRVAVATAMHDPAVLRQVRELKPDLLLQKPIDLAVLRRWLDKA